MMVMVPEWLNGEPTGVVHRVHLPSVSENGFYRQTTSYGAFRNAMSLAVYGKPIPPKWFCPQREDEWQMLMESEQRLFTKYGIEPISRTFVDHGSIWDFYKAIQWDYKKKRFIA